MKKEYWIILIIYIAMQLSSIIGIPVTHLFGEYFGKSYYSNGILSLLWILISFSIALIIILFLLRKEMFNPMRDEHALPTLESIYWAIVGIFLAFFAQTVAANIEYLH